MAPRGCSFTAMQMTTTILGSILFGASFELAAFCMVVFGHYDLNWFKNLRIAFLCSSLVANLLVVYMLCVFRRRVVFRKMTTAVSLVALFGQGVRWAVNFPAVHTALRVHFLIVLQMAEMINFLFTVYVIIIMARIRDKLHLEKKARKTSHEASDDERYFPFDPAAAEHADNGHTVVGTGRPAESAADEFPDNAPDEVAMAAVDLREEMVTVHVDSAV